MQVSSVQDLALSRSDSIILLRYARPPGVAVEAVAARCGPFTAMANCQTALPAEWGCHSSCSFSESTTVSRSGCVPFFGMRIEKCRGSKAEPTLCSPSDAASKSNAGPTASTGGLVAAQPHGQRTGRTRPLILVKRIHGANGRSAELKMMIV